MDSTSHSERAERDRLLDPIDRVSEVLFGLIMAVTIVGSLSVATAGREDVRTAMAAALGCNLAWGLVDAVMYLVRTLTERTRVRKLAMRVVDADAASAHRLIEEALPPHIAAITGPDELDGMRRRLLSSSSEPRRALGLDDFLAAFGIFVLVVLATFPVVVPFILIEQPARAMAVSQVVAVVMLFVSGFALGRYAEHVRPAMTGLAMAVFGVALIAAVKALGG